MGRTKASRLGQNVATALLIPSLVVAIIIRDSKPAATLAAVIVCIWSEYRLGFFK